MPRTTRRPLTLHVSALSNAEYTAYTTSLADVTSPMPDVDWEHITVGVREARGWIRGRYGVDGAVIDQILRYFCPELGSHDTLTGGQFFAALRLLCHAQTGATPDQSLVFVQANPDPPAVPGPRSPPLSRTPSTKCAPPPPPRPTPDSTPTPTLPPRTAPPVPSPNPFTRTPSHPASPRSRAQPLPSDKDKEEPTSAPAPASSNPFRHSNPKPKPKAPASLSSASSTSSSPSTPSNPKQYAYSSPPLPPRKPTASLLPPPRHASLSASLPKSPHTPSTPNTRPPSTPNTRPPSTPNTRPPLVSSQPSTHTAPPASALLPPPPKPPKPPHPTSPLIKQSLQAAKGAQSVKEVLEGLRKERRWEVIKKSGAGSRDGSRSREGSGESGSGSGSGGNGHGHGDADRGRDGMLYHARATSPPESFYDVAAARIRASPTSSPALSRSSSPARDAGHDRTPHVPDAGRTPQTPTPYFEHVITPDTPPSPLTPAQNIPPTSATQSPFSSPNSPSPFSSPSSPSTGTSTIPRRSKSLHHPSPASTTSSPHARASTNTHSPHAPPKPPPRRKRPESVQVTGSPFTNGNRNGSGSPSPNGTHGPGHTRSASGVVSSPLSRHLSFSGPTSSHPDTSSTSSSPSNSVIDTLHRTLSSLRPGPGFESARIKAEGRMWPGGYVKGLARGPGYSARGEGVGAGERLVGDDDGFGQDEGEGGFGQDREDVRRLERDELKMPVRPGEGWAEL